MESFYLGEEGALARLDAFSAKIESKRRHFMGYPCNAAFKLDAFFKWWARSSLSHAPLNEVGNPQTKTTYTLNARPFEEEVLRFFASLFSIDPFWGYITSGGTQGNEQGLYMGRHVLSKKGKPILYFSKEAHYSVASLGKILDIESCAIEVNERGEMDYDDLKKRLDPSRPALFSLSIGTTFKGAIDDIEKIVAIVKERGVRDVFYHADAALFGGYLPFCHSKGVPLLDFSRYPYDSIAISGHKFFGSPVPLGIFLIKKIHTAGMQAEYIEYIHSANMTIPCSRSALNTMIFWWIISTTPYKNFEKETAQILRNASLLYEALKKRGWPVWLNPYSNTVFFKAPPEKLSREWVLALNTCAKLGPLAHAVIMQHVDEALLEEFLHDFDEACHA